MNKITLLLFVMTMGWIPTSKANKFDVPSHLIGINSSATADIKSYLKYVKVNLAYESCDDEGPIHIKKAMAIAIMIADLTINQDWFLIGSQRFREAVGKIYSPLVGRKINPDEEVLATVGATGGVYNAIIGHTSPGEEWIVLQPTYTIYVPMILSAKGVPKYAFLKPRNNSYGPITSQDWVIDRAEMESLFNERTKGIVLSNPLNPLGKVLTREELKFIAELAKKYDTLVVVDEALEWLAFERHTRMASLPGMWERTITIGSSSKSFVLGGYRVGWAYGAAGILSNCKIVQMRTTFFAPTAAQEAIAIGFEQEIRDTGTPNSYFVAHNHDVKNMRDSIVKAFEKIGLIPIIPAAGYCMLVDWSPYKNKIPADPTFKTKFVGLEFVRWFLKETGVLGFPGSFYYADGNKHLGRNYTRFCYHKSAKTLEKAKEGLYKAFLVKSGNQQYSKQSGNRGNSGNQKNSEKSIANKDIREISVGNKETAEKFKESQKSVKKSTENTDNREKSIRIEENVKKSIRIEETVEKSKESQKNVKKSTGIVENTEKSKESQKNATKLIGNKDNRGKSVENKETVKKFKESQTSEKKSTENTDNREKSLRIEENVKKSMKIEKNVEKSKESQKNAKKSTGINDNREISIELEVNTQKSKESQKNAKESTGNKDNQEKSIGNEKNAEKSKESQKNTEKSTGNQESGENSAENEENEEKSPENEDNTKSYTMIVLPRNQAFAEILENQENEEDSEIAENTERSNPMTKVVFNIFA